MVPQSSFLPFFFFNLFFLLFFFFGFIAQFGVEGGVALQALKIQRLHNGLQAEEPPVLYAALGALLDLVFCCLFFFLSTARGKKIRFDIIPVPLHNHSLDLKKSSVPPQTSCQVGELVMSSV